MKRLFILFLLFLFPTVMKAQLQGRPYLDSLLAELPKSQDDTEQVRLLDTISLLYNTFNPDTGIIYGNSGLKMAERLEWKRGIAKAYNALGANFKAKADNAGALDYYLKALSLFEELNDMQSKEAALGNIGNVYTDQIQYNKALEYDSMALAICEKLKFKEGIERNLGNMGVVYDYQKNFPKALEYYTKALIIAKELNNKNQEAKCLGSIAGVYNQDTSGKDNLSKAIEYGNRALLIYKELGDENGLAINLGNMGENYLDIAKDKTGKLLKSGVLNGDRDAIIQKAIDYFNESIEVSKKINNLNSLYQCYQLLSETYQLIGNHEKALENYILYTTTKDAIFTTENKIKIANLETKRALEVKDRDIQIAELKKQKESFLYIAGIVILIVVIMVVVRKFMHSLKSNQQLATEKKKHLQRIKAQSTVLMDIAYIQSHEVRGPLSTIMGLVELFNYEDPADPGNVELLEGIATVARRLDKIITEVVNKENSLNKDGETDAEETGQ